MKQYNTFVMKLIATILAGLVMIFSCSKDPQNINLKTDDSLIGSWEWIKTIDAWRQQTITPPTEGYTSVQEFKANDSVYYFRNAIPTMTYHYKLKYRINDPLNPNSDSTLILKIGNGVETFFNISNGILILNQSYVDGPTEYYKRGK